MTMKLVQHLAPFGGAPRVARRNIPTHLALAPGAIVTSVVVVVGPLDRGEPAQIVRLGIELTMPEIAATESILPATTEPLKV